MTSFWITTPTSGIILSKFEPLIGNLFLVLIIFLSSSSIVLYSIFMFDFLFDFFKESKEKEGFNNLNLEIIFIPLDNFFSSFLLFFVSLILSLLLNNKSLLLYFNNLNFLLILPFTVIKDF